MEYQGAFLKSKFIKLFLNLYIWLAAKLKKMKRNALLLCLILLISPYIGNAQTEGKNSPAQSYITKLNLTFDELEKLEKNPNWSSDFFISKFKSWLHSANLGLKDIIEKDPNYDISNFKNRLNYYQQVFDKNAYPEKESEANLADFQKMLVNKTYKIEALIDDKIGNGAGWVHSYFNTENYLADAIAANYPQVLKETIEGKTKFPAHNKAYQVEKIIGFEAKYNSFYNETVKSVINNLIESAYENKILNAQEAIKYIEQSKQLSEAALAIIPNNVAANTMHKDVLAAYSKITGEVYRNIYTSQFHQDNAGKVIFFTKKPTIQSEDLSSVENTYVAGDFIYSMVYLKGSFKDLAKATNDIKVTATLLVDGTEKASYQFRMSWAYLQQENSHIGLEIIPDPTTSRQAAPAQFAAALANLSPRKHTITIRLSGMQFGSSFMNLFGEGEFILDCSTGQDKLAGYALKYREKNLASVFMPTAKMKSTTIETSIKKALQNEGWEDNKQIQRVVITGNEWVIHRHKISGVILYRTISAAVAFKTDKGECLYWNLTFQQQFNGSSYGITTLKSVGSNVDLSCANVLK